MLIMNRDKELCRRLHSFGLLTTRQVAATLFPGIALTTILRRLRKLEEATYIRRIEGLLNNEKAWALTNEGANLVSVQNSKVHFRKDQLDHDLKLTELRLALEACGIVRSWIPEHEIRAKVSRGSSFDKTRHLLIPDGILGVEHNGFKESLALELELNYKNSRRYERIFCGYEQKKNLWGVWYLVSNEMLGRSIKKVAERELKYNQKLKFFWSTVDDVISNPLDAKLYGRNETHKLSEIFATNPGIKPAQQRAHEVST
ncbi:MAG: replication-relaxation family protein [Bdellovibrionales bacterium]